ncbi:MAG: GGDEF domain-containing protein [Bacillota bacterium]|nr:GGDEF domain-containing protein [Bacillota bacterium]
MKKVYSENKFLVDLKSRIFQMILIISISAFGIVALVNTINSRPIVNIIYPVTAAIVIYLMYFLFRKGKNKDLIKKSYLFLLCNIYLPLAWLTSPGSYSAMSFYAVLILFISIILVNTKWEYIFPISIVVEMIILLKFEPLYPDQFTIYSAPEMRSIDLIMNFLVVAGIFFVIVVTLNRYFDYEHHRIYNVSVTDQLTGLYNRHYLFHIIENYRHMVPTQEFAFVMMDLNHFKRVNDVYGHTEGDHVLKAFALALKEASRKTDVVARYGGDEFVVVLPGADYDDFIKVKSRIIEFFKPTADQYKAIDLSIGFGFSQSQDLPLDDIIKIADLDLYKDKKTDQTR